MPRIFMDDRECLLRYFVLQHRLMREGPYSVRLSAEAAASLILRVTGAACHGFGLMLDEIASNRPIWPRQSRHLVRGGHAKKADVQHDLLFNDWGIQHLHLGARIEDDGFVERTDEIAFVMLVGSTLLVLDVRPHGAWDDVGLLEIVERNWPSAFAPFTPNGVLALQQTGPVRRGTMRRAGITTMTQLRTGRILVPPGGGYSTSGHSTQAVMKMDRHLTGLRQLQEYALAHETEWLHQVRKVYPAASALDLHVELPAQGVKLEIVDRASGVAVRSPNGPLPALVGL